MAGAAALSCATRSFADKLRANTASCTLTAEQEIGPYYLDLERVRKDITEGRPGLPLKLRLTVVDATRCLPVKNAALDIWHCDAMGVYSGFTANSPDGPPGMPGRGRPPGGFGGRPPGPPPDDDDAMRPFLPPPGMGNRQHDETTFLRGVQMTGEDGVVEFSTIYPGWYMGRDIHIHMRVHIGGTVAEAKYTGGHVSYTGQLFFAEDVSDAVAKQPPYRDHHTERTRQDDDGVFLNEHGSASVVTLSQVNKRSLEDGLVATSVLGIDPAATSKGMRPGGRGRRPPEMRFGNNPA